MKECSNALREAGKEYPKMCSICGFGDCKYPGNYPGDFIEGAFGIYPKPKPPSGEPAVQQPPLSRAELAAVRATAMNLAIQLLGPMTSHEQAEEAAFEFLHKVADRMLKYTMNGK